MPLLTRRRVYPRYLRSSASLVVEGGGLGTEQKGRGGAVAEEGLSRGRRRSECRERLRLLLTRSIWKLGFSSR